jgi:hypothetical protein
MVNTSPQRSLSSTLRSVPSSTLASILCQSPAIPLFPRRRLPRQAAKICRHSEIARLTPCSFCDRNRRFADTRCYLIGHLADITGAEFDGQPSLYFLDVHKCRNVLVALVLFSTVYTDLLDLPSSTQLPRTHVLSG